MSSLHDQLVAATGRGHLERQCGRSVTHRPLGDSANDASVTVLFDEMNSTRDDEAGLRTTRKATLYVSTSLSVDESDQWLDGSELWHTESLGARDGSQRAVYVKRETEERRRPELRRRY